MFLDMNNDHCLFGAGHRLLGLLNGSKLHGPSTVVKGNCMCKSCWLKMFTWTTSEFCSINCSVKWFNQLWIVQTRSVDWKCHLELIESLHFHSVNISFRVYQKNPVTVESNDREFPRFFRSLESCVGQNSKERIHSWSLTLGPWIQSFPTGKDRLPTPFSGTSC